MGDFIQTNYIEVPLRSIMNDALYLRLLMENAVLVNIITHNLVEFTYISEIVEESKKKFDVYEKMICDYIQTRHTFNATDWKIIKSMIFAFIDDINEDTMVDYTNYLFN
jgi:hypothetical protein